MSKGTKIIQDNIRKIFQYELTQKKIVFSAEGFFNETESLEGMICTLVRHDNSRHLPTSSEQTLSYPNYHDII